MALIFFSYNHICLNIKELKKRHFAIPYLNLCFQSEVLSKSDSNYRLLTT